MPAAYESVAVPSTVVVGTASTQVLGPNPMRRAVLLSSSPTNRVTYAFGQVAVLDQGYTVPPNTAGPVLSDAAVGDAVTQPVNAIAFAAGTTVGIVEFVERQSGQIY